MRCYWGPSSAPLPSLAIVPRADGIVDASESEIVACLASVAMPDSFHIYATTFLSDATNSSVWKRKKLNSTMITQTWVKVEDKELGGNTPSEWWEKSSQSRTSLCDIQAAEDGTGAGQIAMLIKQFKSVGVPTWLDCTHAVVNKATLLPPILPLPHYKCHCQILYITIDDPFHYHFHYVTIILIIIVTRKLMLAISSSSPIARMVAPTRCAARRLSTAS